jgi:hypothetical protein
MVNITAGDKTYTERLVIQPLCGGDLEAGVECGMNSKPPIGQLQDSRCIGRAGRFHDPTLTMVPSNNPKRWIQLHCGSVGQVR